MKLGTPARFAAGLALTAALSAACQKSPVSFEVDLPTSLDDRAVWVEVAAYQGGSCAALGPEAFGGLPQGYSSRITFRLSDAARPAMGTLQRKSYAFVGTVRDATCGVIGAGCVSQDVGSGKTVVVSMRDLARAPPPPGTCASDAVCTDAACVSSNDSTNPAVGTGCTLQMIGAGPLGGRILDGDVLADENVGSPAVVATDTGFLIAYREMATQLGRARIRLITVDPGGGTQGATGADLPRCTGDDEKDGVGLALAGPVGLVAMSRHSCPGANAGVDYLALDPTGNAGGYAAVFNAQAPDQSVELSYGRSIAPSPTAGTYNVTYLQSGSAIFAQAQVGALGDKPTEAQKRVPLFGSGGPYLETHVASSDKVLAFLSRSASAAPPPGDAGGSGGPQGPTLHLQILPASATPATFGAPTAIDIPGPWGAVAANAGNVAVVTEGTALPLSVRVFDANAKQVAETEIASSVADPYLGADVAFVDNRILIAAARAGSISLFGLSSGADAGGLLPEVRLDQDPRVPDLRAYRDGHVAIAATSTRVLVAWTTATSLTGSDSTGGYALYACAR